MAEVGVGKKFSRQIISLPFITGLIMSMEMMKVVGVNMRIVIAGMVMKKNTRMRVKMRIAKL